MPKDPIDAVLENTFPASDPPNWTATHAGAPSEVLGAVAALRDRVLSGGPLDTKTVELIALATLAAQGPSGQESARQHAVAARKNGASIEEVRQALAVAAVVSGLGALELSGDL
ncbi:MAG: carboxymuconolactone decarboxylase family protein [Polyangiaceae bacterium]|nr:carboxymuconolactone decarboxylase family protein [Polyangiaceae bacterium]